MNFITKKRALGIGFVVLISLVATYQGIKRNYEQTGTFTAGFDYLDKPVIVQTPEVTQKPEPQPTTPPSPTTFLIEQVPFTPQAPHAVWDTLHEDACEEAAVLMAARYTRGERSGLINPDSAEAEIQKIVAWEREEFGYFEDTTAEQTAQILREYYSINNVSVRHDISITDIKKELGQGKLVIVPAAGRLLGNPFFKQPGPIYHMLLLIGYTKDTIITNDPGTKRGEGFRYKNDVLFNAIHDWTGSDDTIAQGRKAMIVVE